MSNRVRETEQRRQDQVRKDRQNADANRAIVDRIPPSERRNGYFDAPQSDTAEERDYEREDVLDLLELAVEQMSLLRRTLARQQKEI